MKTVLAPIDFSSVTVRVVDQAIEIARAVGGRLVLLHVVPASANIPGEFEAPETAEKATRRAAEKAAGRLRELQVRLHEQGVTAHVVHRVGPPGATIVEQAERLEADYIVMGSHGHGAFYDLLVGSTTSRVLKVAACPVAIVPAGEAKSKNGRESARPPRFRIGL